MSTLEFPLQVNETNIQRSEQEKAVRIPMPSTRNIYVCRVANRYESYLLLHTLVLQVDDHF